MKDGGFSEGKDKNKTKKVYENVERSQITKLKKDNFFWYAKRIN